MPALPAGTDEGDPAELSWLRRAWTSQPVLVCSKSSPLPDLDEMR